MGAVSSSSPSVSLPPTNSCIPAGSSCFGKRSETGCDDLVCGQKVCEVEEKCCSNRWGKKCKKEAEELCTPCKCVEDLDGVFLLKMKQLEAVTKTCDGLKIKQHRKRTMSARNFKALEIIKLLA